MNTIIYGSTVAVQSMAAVLVMKIREALCVGKVDDLDVLRAEVVGGPHAEALSGWVCAIDVALGRSTTHSMRDVLVAEREMLKSPTLFMPSVALG